MGLTWDASSGLTWDKHLIIEGDDVALPLGQQGGVALFEVHGAEDGLSGLGLLLVLPDDLAEGNLRQPESVDGG